jgi:hypothetical protein
MTGDFGAEPLLLHTVVSVASYFLAVRLAAPEATGMGGGTSAYALSKAALHAITRMLVVSRLSLRLGCVSIEGMRGWHLGAHAYRTLPSVP